MGETENIHILHSRFIREDRAKLEHEILNFGRTYDENGQIDCRSGIWISTSLVEASLDIDFDYLFTELLDLNLCSREWDDATAGEKANGTAKLYGIYPD